VGISCERDEYKIEKVVFESRPGFLVTGNLCVPKGGKVPRPGVAGPPVSVLLFTSSPAAIADDRPPCRRALL
jgi:hypothetical protein